MPSEAYQNLIDKITAGARNFRELASAGAAEAENVLKSVVTLFDELVKAGFAESVDASVSPSGKYVAVLKIKDSKAMIAARADIFKTHEMGRHGLAQGRTIDVGHWYQGGPESWTACGAYLPNTPIESMPDVTNEIRNRLAGIAKADSCRELSEQ